MYPANSPPWPYASECVSDRSHESVAPQSSLSSLKCSRFSVSILPLGWGSREKRYAFYNMTQMQGDHYVWYSTRETGICFIAGGKRKKKALLNLARNCVCVSNLTPSCSPSEIYRWDSRAWPRSVVVKFSILSCYLIGYCHHECPTEQ